MGHGEVQQARALDALVAEHSQALHMVFREDITNLLQGVLAAENSVGHFQIVFGQHNISSFDFRLPPKQPAHRTMQALRIRRILR